MNLNKVFKIMKRFLRTENSAYFTFSLLLLLLAVLIKTCHCQELDSTKVYNSDNKGWYLVHTVKLRNALLVKNGLREYEKRYSICDSSYNGLLTEIETLKNLNNNCIVEIENNKQSFIKLKDDFEEYKKQCDKSVRKAGFKGIKKGLVVGTAIGV